jgi:hypothetical protein
MTDDLHRSHPPATSPGIENPAHTRPVTCNFTMHTAHCCAVGDQAGDGLVGLVEVLAASDPALQRPPLLVLGVGVLDADPFRGLLCARFLPGRQVLGRSVLLRLQRWGLDLVGELLGQSPVSSVHLGFDLGEPLEQVADALGFQRGLVVLAAGPEGPRPQRAALLVGDDGGLLGVLPHLPGDERPAAGLVRPRASDPDLGAVDPQFHAFGSGVGEDIGQRTKPHIGTCGHGEAAGREQRADLVDGAGDRGAVHSVEQSEGGMRKLEAQDDQGDDDPVREDEFVVRSRSGGALPVMAPAFTQPGLLPGHPRPGQLGDQLAQAAARDPRTDMMAQGRAGPS